MGIRFITVGSLVAALLALFVSIFHLVDDRGPREIQGVCVSYDVNTVGTVVDRLVYIDGNPMCETGNFISINPGKSKEAE